MQIRLRRSVSLCALLLVVVIMGWYAMASALRAADVSDAQFTITVSITNTGTDRDDIPVAFEISGASLVDDSFIESDALNAVVQKDSTDVPGMPPTARIAVAGAVTEFGSSFTDQSTAAGAAAGTFPLLAAAPTVGDAVYFGMDFPGRILTLNTGTAGAGTWTIVWEYRTASDYTSFSNVVDRTSGFTTGGQKTTSWDMPSSDWITSTTTGASATAYWLRARVDTFSSQTTQPVGEQAWFENGQWWVFVEDLDVDDQQQVILNLGGADMVTAHQLFPGTAGITTDDSAGLELGNTYSVAIEGRLNFSAAAANACILCKTGAITLNVSGSAVSPAIGTSITGASTSTSTGDVTGITVPGTGEQIIIMASDGVNAATWVNAGGGMTSYPVQTITNNANNLTWASNGGLDYLEWVRLDEITPTVFDFDTSYTDFTAGTLTNTQAYTGALGLAN